MKSGGILPMQSNHEELIIRNPALGACIFWYLARRYAESAHGTAPFLPLFLLSSGMLYHRATTEKIYRMQFDSGLLKAIVERPDLLAGLQARVERNANATFRALQVGVAARLLQREGGDGFPTFRALGGEDLPVALREQRSPVPILVGTAKRLGAWFAAEPFDTLRRQLNVEF